jgi:hypothetical protein
VGAIGEIANVNHVFQPDGRLAASNSPYAFKFRYPCMLPTGKMLSDLWAHSENTRSETTKNRTSTGIVRDLLISISNEADEDLFREKLRGAPIEMKINAALNLRIGILEIVGEPRNTRKRVPGRRIQIGVAAATIDGTMTDAEVGDAIWIIGADRNVSGRVGHEVMNA